MKYCQNCGHECHCGTVCVQNHKDGDQNEVQIHCCASCRHDDIKINEEKYNTMDYDSFNGA